MAVIVVAELGINHSGSLETAIEMIAQAKASGADLVKFQKREPRLSVPRSEWDKPKETPWGLMSYIEYKERLEFSLSDFVQIDRACGQVGIAWFLSVWDIPSVRFALDFALPYVKVPSAKLTDGELLGYARGTRALAILSTGMSTPAEVNAAVNILRPEYLLACTSTYPCPAGDLNLRTITTFQREYPGCTIGWSGHEVGLAPSLAAVALGAQMIERHFTLDRSSWGTDQAASVEPAGFKRMVKDIRLIEKALGDGVKRVMPSEAYALRHLRGVEEVAV